MTKLEEEIATILMKRFNKDTLPGFELGIGDFPESKEIAEVAKRYIEMAWIDGYDSGIREQSFGKSQQTFFKENGIKE